MESFPTVERIYAVGGYEGDQLNAAVLNIENSPIIEIVRQSNQSNGFVVIARRWVVERTFAWLVRFRRLTKDWQKTIQSSERWLLIAIIRRTSRT